MAMPVDHPADTKSTQVTGLENTNLLDDEGEVQLAAIG